MSGWRLGARKTPVRAIAASSVIVATTIRISANVNAARVNFVNATLITIPESESASNVTKKIKKSRGPYLRTGESLIARTD
jgi:hypothetical protein